VFLETPGFNANENTFSDYDEIRNRLAMSDAIRKWQLHQDGDRPTKRVGAYMPPNHNDSNFKSFNQEVGNIERLFKEVKVGDIIMSPPLGHFKSFLMGEVTKGWSPDDVIEVPYFDNELVPVRKIKWLSGNVSRRDFPNNLAKRLINRHAISEVDPVYTFDILQMVYPSFVWRNHSKLDLYGTRYQGDDPIQVLESAKLLKFAVAASMAHDLGKFDDFQSLSYSKAIEKYYNKELIEQFGINFNSPGLLRAILENATASPKIAAYIAVLTSSTAQPLAEVKKAV
tara:strand:+ start:330 stop:1181 length:852 start_codon:yes stop_codon:yes gene_type:complete